MVKQLKQATILFAGDSGDGIQLTGAQFTQTTALAGNDLSTFPDFPAEIRAPVGTVSGVSGFQIHFGSIPINAPGDSCDVLVVMNAAALKKNLDKLKKKGIIIANSDGFSAKDLALARYPANFDPLVHLSDDYQIFSVPIESQTKQVLKETSLGIKERSRSKNMFALGFVYWLFSRSLNYTESYLKEKFKNKPEILEANILSLRAGHHFGEISDTFTETYTIAPAQMPIGQYRNISGNLAVALALVCAGHRSKIPVFYSGYPITPASDILHHLSSYKHMGIKVVQAEDEIAAATMAIGASFGGNLGVTGTSGPGMALKTEALGLAFMLEVPLVVINVQRGGPSTGLPTKTEQADLMQAIFGRNGEAPIPVLAPSSPSRCFDITYRAAKIAIEHMTPVIVLSDGYLANGSEPWRYPQVETLEAINPIRSESQVDIKSNQNQEEVLSDTFKPYKRNDYGVRPWALPGTPGFEHRLGGLEKEAETGNISYNAENHHNMVNARQSKIDAIAQFLPLASIDSGLKSARLLIVSWGGTYGVIKTAMKQMLEEGLPVAHLHLEYLYPFQKNLGEILKPFDKILVPELNNKQLVLLLQAYFVVKMESINKIAGVPFKSTEIINAVKTLL